MTELIISYSGIRGIVGDSLTDAVAERYGAAFGQLVTRRHDKPRVLLARDTRSSGPALLAAAARGLAPYGRLVDLGVVATPTLQHALGALDAQAALCITASHNPQEWNGLKLMLGPENIILDHEQVRELIEIAAAISADPVAASRVRLPRRHAEAVRNHAKHVCEQVDVPAIRARGLRVAVDSAGGAGEEVVTRLLERLGCEMVPVRVVRDPEPVPEQLGELSRAVSARGCDLGLAQDLDGDRLALVCEDGAVPGEELTLALVVDHLLARSSSGRRIVVKNLTTSRIIDDLCARHGAEVVETPVGEVNLSRALIRAVQDGATAFGGEGNGGIIFPPISFGRDSIIGAALVLERLSRDRRPLSEQVASLPRYAGRKEKVPRPSESDLGALFATVSAAFPGARVDRLDGLRLSFEDGSWLSLRPSNTEPILRLIAESQTPGWAGTTLARVRALINNFAGR